MYAPSHKQEIRAARAMRANPLVWPVTVVAVFTVLVACEEVSTLNPWAADAALARQRVEDRDPTNAVNDANITTQVKTALFGDPQASGYSIHVNTYRGIVQLSGFVDTRAQKRHAGELVQAIGGVRKVHNDLIITSEDALSASGERAHFIAVNSHQGAKP